jgi:hypothetical protein
MTRVIRVLEALNLEKSWSSIPNKLNIKWWNWKKNSIIQKGWKNSNSKN